jgi:predicted dehydrogenase
MIRAAIVGMGWWGRTLVNSVQGQSGAIRFTAGQTRTPAKAADFCREKDIRLHDDLAAVLADPQVDAVVFATPHTTHEEQVKRAAAAGKHVFVEKPIAFDARGATAVVEAALKAKVVLQVGYQRRFHPHVIELRQRIRDGRLGTVLHVEAEATASAGLALPKDSWRVDPVEAPAGALTGLGVHTVDNVIDLLGEIEEVYCVSVRRAAPHIDDTTSIHFVMKNGASATALSALSTVFNYRIAAYGTRGLAEISKPTMETFTFTPLPEGPPTGWYKVVEPEIIECKKFDPVKASLEAFAAAIEGDGKFPIPPEQLVHGAAAFEAIVRSAATRQPVKVGGST